MPPEPEASPEASSDSLPKPNPLAKEPASRPGTERRFIQRQVVQPLIQWIPLGGSSFLFASHLLKQEWMLVLLTFPVTVVTAVWAAYSKGFVERLSEIYADRSKKDADALVAGMDSLDKALKWQLSGFESKYLKCQAIPCKSYATEEFKQPEGILNPELDEVFVPLQLSAGSLGWLRRDVSLLNEIDPESEPPSLLIWDFLAQINQVPAYRSLAILAPGGSGKTTLLRHIVHTYAQYRHRKYRAPKLVPVLLYLRKWRNLLAAPDAPTLPQLIEQHIRDLPNGKNLILPPYWAENLLRQGKALIMLDGFDEVQVTQRSAVSQWIADQMQEYGSAVFILTSRPSGYEEFNAQKPATTLEMLEFQLDQRQRFIQQWYLCQETLQRGGKQTADVKDRAQRYAADLVSQIAADRDGLGKMAGNPLLLTLIARLHRVLSR
ncbi:MAG: hypothetical protein DCF22_08555 [Leptolyngbya sp.]|nr:MAG: hypothetical protein DCF22_08555 [Leptolyngbya sp.]